MHLLECFPGNETGYEEQAPDWRHLLVEHWMHSGQEDSPLRFEITLINEEKTSGSMVINIFNFDYRAVKGCHFALTLPKVSIATPPWLVPLDTPHALFLLSDLAAQLGTLGLYLCTLGVNVTKFNEIICLRKAWHISFLTLLVNFTLFIFLFC